jgi:large subunit ribosomal protein L15
MFQHELKPTPGSRQARKRVGRGAGSGMGTYSGRGCNGQNSRTGGGVRIGFEGGQTPLYRRLPKLKGFTNPFRVEFQVINVSDLATLKLKVVNAEVLHKVGLITKASLPVKLLGTGDLMEAVTVHVNKVSKSAQEKVEKAGGKVEVIVEKGSISRKKYSSSKARSCSSEVKSYQVIEL